MTFDLQQVKGHISVIIKLMQADIHVDKFNEC